ncbi:MAG: hypothetical protein VW620_10515 [Rhodospirillales bacterium]
MVLMMTHKLNHTERETIVLKDINGNYLAYDETTFTSELRAFLKRYNDLLLKSEISHPIHHLSSFTYYVCNLGSWALGGNFYNDWQTISLNGRSGILFNGMTTVEIDYSAVHPYLIYAEKGIPIPLTLDAFLSLLTPNSLKNESSNAAKLQRMFFLMINSKSEREAFKLFGGAVSEARPVLEAVKSQHSQIADEFCQDKGTQLVRRDAELVRNVLEIFTQATKPILAIQNSFIVETSENKFLASTIFNALKQTNGSKLNFQANI